MQAFKIKKKYVAGLATWLNSLQLSGRQSRERTRFVALLTESIKNTGSERKEILEKYVEKETDENGKEVWKTEKKEDGTEHYVVSDENKEAFDTEIAELYEEDFVLDIGEEHKEKVAALKDIVLNTDFKFGMQEGDAPHVAVAKIKQANEYDEWCKAFETLNV